jgi:hypothetical protein
VHVSCDMVGMTGSERRAESRAQANKQSIREQFENPKEKREILLGFASLAAIIGVLLVIIAEPWR